MPIAKIVSSGQAGAARGALDAAICCNLPHGGWCAGGRRAEDGVIPAMYDLQEVGSPGSGLCCRANVTDADATVVFTDGELIGCAARSLECAKSQGKLYLHIDIWEYGPDYAVSSPIHSMHQHCGVLIHFPELTY